jgi:hypothetical protein
MNSFIIGLPSWTIQDGNYENFKRGDPASFALEFYAPTELVATEADGQSLALNHIRDSTYRLIAQVFHIREIEWWALMRAFGCIARVGRLRALRMGCG